MSQGRFSYSDNEIISAYQDHGSCLKAGQILGVSPQTFCRWLAKTGHVAKQQKFTLLEAECLRRYYEDTAPSDFSLDEISRKLGRRKTHICSKAKEMGLTNQAREHSASHRLKNVGPDWTKYRHPKGATGIKFSAEALNKISAASKESWARMKRDSVGAMSPENLQRKSDVMAARNATTPAENAYSRTKSGRRVDLGGMFLRSSWEANYARYLNWLVSNNQIEKWEYEVDTFWFEKIRRGVRSYKPDFKIFEKNQAPYYVEVKGWMDPKSATKLKRMKKYYPSIRVDVVGQREYSEIRSKVGRMIPNWE